MGRINLQTFCRSHLLFIIKKSIKFVVSFSLLSFLISYFSLITLFLRSFNSSNFSSVTLPIFSHSWDKNYMFLLCNGILVFLGSNSGLFGGGSSDVKNVSIQPPAQELPEKTETETRVVAVAEQEGAMICGGKEGIDNGFLIPVGHDRENEFSIVRCEDQYEEQQENGVLVVEEEGEGTELMSAEELNKKCDEFIKKMKEGIKWESQQLVMVQ